MSNTVRIHKVKQKDKRERESSTIKNWTEVNTKIGNN